MHLMKRLFFYVDANKKIIRTLFIVFLTIQNALGVVNTFAIPLPIPPRTSIGVMTIMAIVLVMLALVIAYKKIMKLNKSITPVDILLLSYVCLQAISLLLAPVIYQLVSFRLLLIATVQYVLVRLYMFNENEKKTLIIGLGICCFVLSLASVFQVFFRMQAILFAKQFLFGDAAYGVVWELNRGRVPFWGNLTIVFPFLVGSLLLFRYNNMIERTYLYISLFILPFSFATSNFRWITLCFIFGIIMMAYFFIRTGYFSPRILVRPVVITLGSIACALFFASTVFHYNLIDRIIFKDFNRDVTQSIGRLYLYQQAMEVFTASPLLGVGIGNYASVVDPIIGVNFIGSGKAISENERQTISSHNDILTILAEGGALSFFVYVIMSGYIVFPLIRFLLSKTKDTHYFRLYTVIVSISLVMYYTYGIFENIAPNNYIFVFFLFASTQSLLSIKHAAL